MGGDGRLHLCRCRARRPCRARPAARSAPAFSAWTRSGWSTLVQIVEASESDRAALVDALAAAVAGTFRRARSADAARVAAEEEVAFAASLCNQPQDTLIAVHRSFENGEIREAFRTPAAARRAEAAARLLLPGRRRRRAEPDEHVDLAQPAAGRAEVKDFWLACGHHLLDRDEGGGLLITDEFLKVYLARPELAPPPEACAVEKTLHAALMADPRRAVSDRRDRGDRRCRCARELDADDRVPRSSDPRTRRWKPPMSISCARGLGTTPPLFLNQLVHVILRNALDGCEDPLVLRAAEIFFRPQRMTLHEGSLIAADEETIAGTSGTPASPLVSMLGIPGASRNRRDERRQCRIIIGSTATCSTPRIDLTAGRRGLEALARGDRALDRRICSSVDVDGRTARPKCATSISPGMSGSTPTAPDRRRALERRGDRRGGARARRRALPSELSATPIS